MTKHASSDSLTKNNVNVPPIEFSSSLMDKNNEDSGHQVKGYITKEAIYLENQLLSNLNGVNEINNATKILHIGNTFDEVIKRDKNFGRLLTKIKQAYDAYLE